MIEKVEKFEDGFAILGDSTSEEVKTFVEALVGKVPLVIADPPYGKVLLDKWDRVETTDIDFCAWMLSWTKKWKDVLLPGASMYVWGGIGKVGFRPFFRYIVLAEEQKKFELANLITWKKRRGYGKKKDYLFCREECAWFVNGEAQNPRLFNIPLLDEKRGYAGYNKKYPAKSEFLRRSNVWVEPELLRGKVHSAQKAQRVIEIPIEVHTAKEEYVIDPFAGSGTTAFACRRLGRKFVVIEKDKDTFEKMVERLRLGHVNDRSVDVISAHGREEHSAVDTNERESDS